jgi:tetratricopeptide (TPR) repeat protein
MEGPAPARAGELRYWAFISYSHADSRIAARLERALESYSIPRQIVGQPTPLGPVPARIKPVYRDRSELRAGSDLLGSVRDALLRSRYLIVVCSPAAVHSRWVNQEIVEFKRLYGDGRVLPVIAAGEPFAVRAGGREAEECFPEPLRFTLAADDRPSSALEPLAADLRPHRDGWRLATLKLIAGMLGGAASLGQLARRDAQRRTRRLAAVAAALLLVATTMSVLAVVAMRSRSEAQARRVQAEGLVEYMLGDLRQKVDQTGHLEILDSVGEKALAYYAHQSVTELDPDALGRRARALHLIGQIREQRGQLDQALTAFESAAESTAQLLSESPNDGTRIFDHAQSVFWVGYVAHERGQLSEAERSFKQYQALALRLIELDPSNLDWQLEPAYAAQNLGVVKLEQEHADDALVYFVQARDAFARIASRRPAVGFELADAEGWTAKTREAEGNYSGAQNDQLARLQVLEGLEDAAQDTGVRHQISNVQYELARLKLYLGDFKGAEPAARAAVQQAEALFAIDTTNLFWLSELCFDRLRLVEAELAIGDTKAARSQADLVQRDAPRLMASDPTRLNWQVNLRGFLVADAAAVARAEGRAIPTEESLSYLESMNQLESAGKQLTATQHRIIAAVELIAGDQLRQLGRVDEARTRWKSAAQRLMSRFSARDYAALTGLARILLRLDDMAQTRSLAARVQVSEYRDPSYDLLIQELAQRREATQRVGYR